MAYPQGPQDPQGPYFHVGQTPPPRPDGSGTLPHPPKKGRGPLFWLLAVGAPSLLLVTATGAALVATAAITPTSTAAPTSEAPAAVVNEQPTTTEPEPVEVTPNPSDFEITIKVLEKQCFGSAGCNITYRISPGYGGPDLSEDTEWRVIYEVRGGEDGPQINSFTLRGDQIEYQSEEFLSVSSSAKKLRGKVTEVLEN